MKQSLVEFKNSRFTSTDTPFTKREAVRNLIQKSPTALLKNLVKRLNKIERKRSPNSALKMEDQTILESIKKRALNDGLTQYQSELRVLQRIKRYGS